jgi:hypothetical protein
MKCSCAEILTEPKRLKMKLEYLVYELSLLIEFYPERESCIAETQRCIFINWTKYEVAKTL